MTPKTGFAPIPVPDEEPSDPHMDPEEMSGDPAPLPPDDRPDE